MKKMPNIGDKVLLGKECCRVVAKQGNDYIVIAPDGRKVGFDKNTPFQIVQEGVRVTTEVVGSPVVVEDRESSADDQAASVDAGSSDARDLEGTKELNELAPTDDELAAKKAAILAKYGM